VQSEADNPIWSCDDCGRDHAAQALRPGEVARCVRCGGVLRANPRTGPKMGLVWSLTALGLFLAAGLTPLMSVEKGGMESAATLLVVARGLVANDMPLLGLLAAGFVVWLPLLLLGILVMVNLAAWRELALPGTTPALWVLRFARQWAMPEVFLLSILVAFLKIGDLAEAEPGAGLWFLLGASIALTAALQRVEHDRLEDRLGPPDRSRGSATAAIAFLIAALVLLVPANALPIMKVRLPGGEQASTIFAGVRTLAREGLWGIALIVFAASILVPFVKVGGLTWLLLTARRKRGTRNAMRLYRFIDFIGRWSMLDIFLVGLLAGLIRFGQLAEIRAGPAAPAFAAAVILTVLAVNRFDPRWLWPASSPSDRQSSPSPS